jgi:twinkle protein
MSTADKTHMDCPDCGHKECMTQFDDGGTYCHSCSKTTINTEHTKGTKRLVTHEEIEKHIVLPYRSIPLSSVDHYGIRTGVSKSGEQIERLYPYPQGDKRRILPKDFSSNKGFSNNELFGMDKFNAGTSRHITIVEGEDDAPSAYFMLGEKFPVIAIPGAGVSRDLLVNCHKYLDSFSEIVVCTDGDAAGEVAAKKIASAFPNKVSRVSLTKHKDPNDFLVNGDQKDFLFAWHNRQKYVPKGIYNTPDQFKGILSQEDMNDYLPTPSDFLNEKIKGLMRGHLTVITGPEGQGKTEILRWLEYDILKNHKDTPIAVLHMEESKKTCLTSLACYELGVNLRDPDHKVAKKDIDDAINELTKDNNLYLFDFGVDEDPLDIVDRVRYFSEVCGCHYIFIDPIQQLSYGKETTDTEEKILSQISVQLERVATELNIGIVLTTHVNDDGQTRSSRMIGKSASVRIDIQRDHMNPDPDIHNLTKLSVSKNRPVGKSGYGGSLMFDPLSFMLREND